MLVNDAFGRKVSLLNDTDGPLHKSSPSHPSPKDRSLSRSNTFNFSRKSSYSSQMSHCSESSNTSLSENNYESPAYSPGLRPTPQLLRFNSSSTQHSVSLQTPSPTSPSYQIDPMDQSKTFTGSQSDPYFRPSTGPYFATPQHPLPGTSQSPNLFSSLDSPQAFTLNEPYVPLQPQAVQFAPYATDLIPTPPLNLTSPTAAVTPASSTPDKNGTAAANAANNGAKPAKKKYPCPHAQKYNCTDTFTTSGHAARHGKKHTGEKNIRCPVCDKAFTRKDNMKQHERTHRNNRDAVSVTSTNADTPKRSKTLSAESTEMSTEMDIDSVSDDAQATIKPKSPGPRRPALSAMQPANPPPMASQVDVVMPVTLDSNEQLQQVAPELKLEPVGKDYAALGDLAFTTRSQENFFGRPPPLDRTTSTGSGFGSQDGEGESPGLDALAMAASMG